MKRTILGYRVGPAEGPGRLLMENDDDGRSREIRVPPLSRVRVENEHNSPAIPSMWDLAPLKSRVDPGRVYTVPGSLIEDSLRLHAAGPGGERQLLVRGEDYDLVPHLCGINLADRWKSAPGFSLDYEMRLQRVDVLAARGGELRLFAGAEALVCPRWPALPEGWQGIARIYLRFRDDLDESAIYAITRPEDARLVNYPLRPDPAARMPGGTPPEAGNVAGSPIWPKAIDYEPHVLASPAARERLERRFRAEGDFRLVYFGDSVTQGGDVDPEWRYTRRFASYLARGFPGKRTETFNAAIGGTSSSYGRERFQRDVLAHDPSAVTILFALNDKGMDDETFLANHRHFVSELRKRNAEPILFTSNMNTESRASLLPHAEERIVEFCCEEDLICLDAYGIWKDLPRYGIPYETLLGNGINHPDRVAAGVFHELLKSVFPRPGGGSAPT